MRILLLITLAAGLTGWGMAHTALAQEANPGKRVAFLVAINQYKKPFFEKLKYAEQDVTDTETALKSLGFQTTTLLGSKATRKAIDDAVTKLVEPLTQEDVVLVLLCGHGQQMDVMLADGTRKNDAFYCPFDAVASDPKTLYSLSHLIDEQLAPNVGRKLVLVDACRNDPDPGRGRGIEGKVIALPEDTAVMFSCRKGQRSFEHDDLKHGLFTYCVLEGLNGQAAKNGSIAWSGVVAHVSERMASPEFARYIPEGRKQEPIPAGGVPFTVLGRPSAVLESRKAGDTRDDNALKLKLVWCPPGKFVMGSPPDEKDRNEDEDQVNVTLSQGFWLGQTEVTQGQVRKVLKIEPWKGKEYVKEGSDYAATYVSWDEATEFCVKLTQVERMAGRLKDGEDYRLPTDAEWEYACRAGKGTAYCFGPDAGSLEDFAWYDKNSSNIGAKYAHAVGLKKANAWGLHDMHGNVYEWCRDGYDAKLSDGTDPENLSKASVRVVRGGGWGEAPTLCRSALRLGLAPKFRSGYLGFRIAHSQSSR